MTPLAVSYGLWAAWMLSWALAAPWSRRSQAKPSALDQAIHLVPTLLGGTMLFFASRVGMRESSLALLHLQLWRPAPALGWAICALCAAGFAFTWWARLTLGDLWSGSVSRKEEHEIVERGPYRLVRHPIYTGLISSAFALAIQIGETGPLAGAALLALGFFLKARLEERFLAEQLGQGAYADYRRRTPMLAPFWPTRH